MTHRYSIESDHTLPPPRDDAAFKLKKAVRMNHNGEYVSESWEYGDAYINLHFVHDEGGKHWMNIHHGQQLIVNMGITMPPQRSEYNSTVILVQGNNYARRKGMPIFRTFHLHFFSEMMAKGFEALYAIFYNDIRQLETAPSVSVPASAPAPVPVPVPSEAIVIRTAEMGNPATLPVCREIQSDFFSTEIEVDTKLPTKSDDTKRSIDYNDSSFADLSLGLDTSEEEETLLFLREEEKEDSSEEEVKKNVSEEEDIEHNNNYDDVQDPFAATQDPFADQFEDSS